jgi:hypothetical protein
MAFTHIREARLPLFDLLTQIEPDEAAGFLIVRTGCLLDPQRAFVMTLRRAGLPERRPPATGLLGHYPDRTLTGKSITASPGHTEYRFEDDPRCLLAHPVTHRRDAQRPLPAVGLGDLHPTHKRRAVDAPTEVTGKLAEHPLDPITLHRLQGHTIDPGGATIRSHPPPRLHQDVIPIDPVIQSMETPTLRLLGRSP